MTIHVAINGFGRIGRLAFRAIHTRSDMEVVAINDLIPPEYMAYLLKYDSTHGPFESPASVQGNVLTVGNCETATSQHPSPSECPWNNKEVDVVIESSGYFTTLDLAQSHLEAGAKRVVISAPSTDAPMYVMGVNHHLYESDQAIVSNASCTTNCIAPVACVLHQNWEIIEGLMTTVHSATASQRTVDGAITNDWRGARSTGNNIIPSGTGAAKAVGKIIPALDGRLTGMAFRVPTTDVSVIDLTVRLKGRTSIKEINTAFNDASCDQFSGILACTQDAVVSSDFIHNSHSAIVDQSACLTLNDHFFKIIAWYDNEWGYANRLVDLAAHISTGA